MKGRNSKFAQISSMGSDGSEVTIPDTIFIESQVKSNDFLSQYLFLFYYCFWFEIILCSILMFSVSNMKYMWSLQLHETLNFHSKQISRTCSFSWKPVFSVLFVLYGVKCTILPLTRHLGKYPIQVLTRTYSEAETNSMRIYSKFF